MSSELLLAQMNFQTGFLLGAKLLVAVVAGLVGWFLFAPVAAILFRLAFQRPASKWAQFAIRIVGALILGILAFLFIPIGTGGLGWGGGTEGNLPGTRPGVTPEDNKPTQKETEKTTPPSQKLKSLPIELITSKDYEGGGKFYLIKGEQPAKTLDEVRTFLVKNKDEYGRVDIVLYANSVAPSHYAVRRLEELAEDLQLEWTHPTKYHSKVKVSEGNSN